MTLLWREGGFNKDELWRVQQWIAASTPAESPIGFAIKRPDGNTKVHLVTGELRELCVQARAAFGEWLRGEHAALPEPHLSVAARGGGWTGKPPGELCVTFSRG